MAIPVEKFWDSKELVKTVNSILHEIAASPDDYEFERGRYQSEFITLTSDARGIYQGTDVAEAFEMTDEIKDEDCWEEGVFNEMILDPECFDWEVQPKADKYAEEATDIINKAGLPGDIYAGWHEYGGFGFGYIVEQEDLFGDLSESEAYDMFMEEVFPIIQERYERDGIPDIPAQREAWNDFIDGLQRDGTITEWAASNWENPF